MIEILVSLYDTRIADFLESNDFLNHKVLGR